MNRAKPRGIEFRGSQPHADETCGYNGCRRRPRVLVTWRHFWKGRWQRARRTRCDDHAREFSRRHKVKFMLQKGAAA